MKLIIAGSRTITDYTLIKNGYQASGFKATEIVSGTARGPDQLGEQLAKALGIPVKRFPADWDGLGKKAGYVRNAQMADYADGLLAFYDGVSRGTMHMIELAKKKKLSLLVYTPQGGRWYT